MHQIPTEAATIIDQGIALWPASIDVVRVYTDRNRYYIDGIFEIKEALSERSKDIDSAILQFNLHDSIHEVIHRHAEHGTILLLNSVSKREVYENFMSRLRYAVSETDLGWKLSEIMTAREFLSRNDSPKHRSESDNDP